MVTKARAWEMFDHYITEWRTSYREDAEDFEAWREELNAEERDLVWRWVDFMDSELFDRLVYELYNCGGDYASPERSDDIFIGLYEDEA